jgi:leader peptidase (prepilin peptidase)/N-methyltransferase
LCRHGVWGDVAASKEVELGISLIPDRELTGSHPTRWSGGERGAPTARHRLLLATALFAIGALALAAVGGTAPIAPSMAVAVMVPAAVIDVEQRRLPDMWLGGALIALIATLSLAAALGDPIESASALSMLGGAVALALPVLVLHLASPNAMGFGDVKAALVLGAAVGAIDWRLGAVALCLAALSGAVVGVLGRHRTIPFGPFLVFGAWVVVLVDEPLIAWLFTGGQAS